MDDFSTTGGYDALGGFSRAWINLSELLYGAGPKTKQFRRCPGANEQPAADGSNVFTGARRPRSTVTRTRGRWARDPARGRRARGRGCLRRGGCAGARREVGRRRRQQDLQICCFDNAFGLTEGGDFKVAGVRAGKTDDIQGREGRAGARSRW